MENMKQTKVMIVAHFCAYGNEKSNNRFNYLAERLSNAGMEVEIVTSSFCHKDKCQRTEICDTQKPYTTKLIYEPSYKKNISLKRLLISHPTIGHNLRKYLENCEKPDVVYCAVPSVDVALQAANYANKQGIPLVLDVLDLWPEAYKLILKKDILYKPVNWLLKRRVNRVYAAANQIVAVSDSYAHRAKSVNKKCENPITVFLGTDAVTFDENIKLNTPIYTKSADEFWIGYCGTLGHSYDLSTVFKAVELLSNRGINNIRLVVMGNGPFENKFKKEASNLGIQCIFTGKLPYGQMCAQLAQCDISVNPIAAGSAASIINKHADYALAGMPVINTQESKEYKDLLINYACGINCTPGAVEQVADAICTLASDKELCFKMGENARRMGIEKFDRQKTYESIVEMISLLDVEF